MEGDKSIEIGTPLERSGGVRAYSIGVTRAYEPRNGIQTVVGGKTLKMHSVAAVGIAFSQIERTFYLQ
jgi:hypothetical protein